MQAKGERQAEGKEIKSEICSMTVYCYGLFRFTAGFVLFDPPLFFFFFFTGQVTSSLPVSTHRPFFTTLDSPLPDIKVNEIEWIPYRAVLGCTFLLFQLLATHLVAVQRVFSTLCEECCTLHSVACAKNSQPCDLLSTSGSMEVWGSLQLQYPWGTEHNV